MQEPSNTSSGSSITPPVSVAVEDTYGNVVLTDNSVVTVTLSGGTFADGSTTETATVVNGVATFDGSFNFAVNDASLTINANGMYTLAPSDAADGITGIASTPFTISAAPPILVGSPVINGDYPNGLYTAAGQPAPGVQRSMVEDVVYSFNEPVTIPNASAAFHVAGTGPHPGTAPPSLSAYAVPGSNGTNWAVVLDAGNVNATTGLGSIANGEYLISVNNAGIFAADDGVTPLQNGGVDTFYRLFGDINGAEVVNAVDNLQLKKAITNYNPAFDSNADGAVTALDNLAFKKDLTVAYFGDGFVPTI